VTSLGLGAEKKLGLGAEKKLGLGQVWEFRGNCLGIVWNFLCLIINYLNILGGNCLGIVWELFGNLVGIVWEVEERFGERFAVFFYYLHRKYKKKEVPLWF
jgi:hypothetical protein